MHISPVTPLLKMSFDSSWFVILQILEAKISRLEHLLYLKDKRIDDLQARVEATRPTGIRR